MKNLSQCAFGATLTLVLMLLPFEASAEIYVHIDEQGRKHFSDRPQPEAKTYQPKTTAQPMQAPQLPKLYQPSSSENQESAERRQQDRKEAQQQRQRCEKLQQKIDKLNAKLRRKYSNQQGNRWRSQRRDYSDKHWRLCRRQ